MTGDKVMPVFNELALRRAFYRVPDPLVVVKASASPPSASIAACAPFARTLTSNS